MNASTTQADTQAECRINIPGKSLDPFVWHHKSIETTPHILALNSIKSLAGGVAAVLELLEADGLNADDIDNPVRVLNDNQTGALMRLAIAASQVIETQCDGAFDWAMKHGNQKG